MNICLAAFPLKVAYQKEVVVVDQINIPSTELGAHQSAGDKCETVGAKPRCQRCLYFCGLFEALLSLAKVGQSEAAQKLCLTFIGKRRHFGLGNALAC